jgi:hypothetical protein
VRRAAEHAQRPPNLSLAVGRIQFCSHERHGRKVRTGTLQADVAQLVERNLAKVEVASSSLVVRSEKGRRSPPWWSGREARQRTANPSTRVQIPSPPRLLEGTHVWDFETSRAIGAVVARFLDTEEVTGSNPVSPTSITAGPSPSAVRLRGFFFSARAATPPRPGKPCMSITCAPAVGTERAAFGGDRPPVDLDSHLSRKAHLVRGRGRKAKPT